MRLHRVVRFLSLSLSILTFTSFNDKSAMTTPGESSASCNAKVDLVAQSSSSSQQSFSNVQLVDEVFSLLKGYLTSQLEEKGKQLERSAKTDNEDCNIKFEGNRKLFELNSQLNNILTQIDDSAENPTEVHKLVSEGKQIIKKRQKLYKIADRNKDGWLGVQEYESDDLTSDSEDEKKLRKTKVAAERKRKEVKSNSGNAAEKFKSHSDSQFFVVRSLFIFTL